MKEESSHFQLKSPNFPIFLSFNDDGNRIYEKIKGNKSTLDWIG
jgi:hypothetical protein